MRVSSPELACQGAFQLGRRAVKRGVDVGSAVRDGDRLPRRNSRLDHAALVIGARLRPIIVAQVHLDSGDLVLEMAHRVQDDLPHVFGHALSAIDIVIRVYLDLHGRFSVQDRAPQC